MSEIWTTPPLSQIATPASEIRTMEDSQKRRRFLCMVRSRRKLRRVAQILTKTNRPLCTVLCAGGAECRPVLELQHRRRGADRGQISTAAGGAARHSDQSGQLPNSSATPNGLSGSGHGCDNLSQARLPLSTLWTTVKSATVADFKTALHPDTKTAPAGSQHAAGAHRGQIKQKTAQAATWTAFDR